MTEFPLVQRGDFNGLERRVNSLPSLTILFHICLHLPFSSEVSIYFLVTIYSLLTNPKNSNKKVLTNLGKIIKILISSRKVRVLIFRLLIF